MHACACLALQGLASRFGRLDANISDRWDVPDAPSMVVGQIGSSRSLLPTFFPDSSSLSEALMHIHYRALALVFLAMIFAVAPVSAQTAGIQLVHNSPDLSLSEVDAYIDGNLVADDFASRTEAESMAFPVGAELTVAVAPSASVSADDAPLPKTLPPNRRGATSSLPLASATPQVSQQPRRRQHRAHTLRW